MLYDVVCSIYEERVTSGCFKKSHLAVLPFSILTASDSRSCGLQSTSRWIWSGITSIARTFISKDFSVSRRYCLTSDSILPRNMGFLYFVTHTI